MNQTQRLSEIIEILGAQKTCQISDLAQKFDVSEETIRRDIRVLEGKNLVYKVHGGVKLPENVFESPYIIRLNENSEAKRKVADHAAKLVKDGMSVLIDSGTTSFWLARALSHVKNMTIITNALEVARELKWRNNNRIFFAGGEINSDYCSSFGMETIDFMRKFTPEIAFLSIGAIDLKNGLMDYYLPEADLKRAIVPLARQTVILADQTKFKRPGLIHVLAFDQINRIVTDKWPEGEDLAAFQAKYETLTIDIAH